MMSLSTLRNALYSPASPLRLVDVAVRLSSTTAYSSSSSLSSSSSPFSSSSSSSSLCSDARPRVDQEDGGNGTEFKRRVWQRRLALGMAPCAVLWFHIVYDAKNVGWCVALTAMCFLSTSKRGGGPFQLSGRTVWLRNKQIQESNKSWMSTSNRWKALPQCKRGL